MIPLGVLAGSRHVAPSGGGGGVEFARALWPLNYAVTNEVDFSTATVGEYAIAAATHTGGVGSVTPPAGWTVLHSTGNHKIWGKIIESPDLTTLTWTHGTPTDHYRMAVSLYSGVSTVAPVAESGYGTMSDTSAPLADLATLGAMRVGIAYGFISGTATWEPPADYIERFDSSLVSSGSNRWHLGIFDTDGVPVSTGSAVATCSATLGYGATAHLALSPA